MTTAPQPPPFSPGPSPAPPTAPGPLVPPDASLCPTCRTMTGKAVTFTMWGGVLGPKLLHHHKCTTCGRTYNSKTGRSNTGGIILYTLVMIVVCAVVLFAIGMLR